MACMYEYHMMTAAMPPPVTMATECFLSTAAAMVMNTADSARPIYTHFIRVAARLDALISAVCGELHAAAMIS